MEVVESIVHLVAVEGKHDMFVCLTTEQRRVGQVQRQVERDPHAASHQPRCSRDPFGRDVVHRTQHVVAAPHIPGVAKAELWDLRQ